MGKTKTPLSHLWPQPPRELQPHPRSTHLVQLVPRASRVPGTLSAIIPIPAQTHQRSPRCAPKFHFLVLANATSSPWTSKHKSSACIPRCLYNLPSPAHQSLRPVASPFITSRHPSWPFYFAAHGSTQAVVSLSEILGVFFFQVMSRATAEAGWTRPYKHHFYPQMLMALGCPCRARVWGSAGSGGSPRDGGLWLHKRQST